MMQFFPKKKAYNMNYLNKPNEFMMCDDKTGAMINVSQRIDAIAAVQHIQILTAILLKAKHPTVINFQIHFSLNALCLHFGWEPHVIASMVQYLTLIKSEAESQIPTTG